MRFSIAITGLATLVSTAIAGTAIVQNNCSEQVFLTITRGDQSSSQKALAGNGGRYSEPISGNGNSFGVTKSSEYYSPNTPKLIWGFSDSAPTLYYSVSAVDGNPFNGQKFQLSASDAACGVVNNFDGAVKACADKNDFTLTLC
jgi:hypothetical protein